MLSVHGFVYRLHLFRHRPDGFEALSYSYFVMKFALGMVDTFGAIFIFQLVGDWRAGLWLVALYVFVRRLLVILFLVPSGKVLNRIGYRRIILLAISLMAGRVYIFTQVTVEDAWLLFVAAILDAGFIALYFLGFHGLFLDDNDDGRIGEQTGYIEMLGRMATVASPFIAGLIVQRASFEMMFGVGMVLLIASAIPLFMMPKHKHRKIDVSVAKVWKAIRTHARFSGSVAAMSMQTGILNNLWPVYLFLVIGSYAAFGSVMSLVMVVSSGVVFAMGKIYDKRPLHRLYPAASFLQAVLWFARFLSTTPLTVITADVLSRVFSPMWWMKIRRYELGQGERMNKVVFGLAHESMVSLGTLLGIVMAMTLMVVFDFNWVVMAVPAALGVLIGGWLVRDK